jgi:hypothetical protein
MGDEKGRIFLIMLVKFTPKLKHYPGTRMLVNS